ncbi:UPF0182 family protein [Rothia sp. ZJ1223]|uniref:UPF0182 family membrane protein n=1 Tax=Rothia sp. ZJ1223 TaxID=2811098 RepID=UPI00195D3C90|nr:UPF0182 family protein [Rothia sp. ZJ1223]
MTTGPSQPRPAPSGKRKNNTLTLTLIIVAVLVMVFVFATQIYTEVLWYNQLGFSNVFVTENLTKAAIFVLGTLLIALPLWVSLRYALKHGKAPQSAPRRPTTPRPRFDANGNPLPPQQDPFADLQEMFNQNLNRYRKNADNASKALTWLIPLGVGAFVATSLMTHWETVLLFLNGTEFGSTDPEFGKDLGFYIFTLPFLNLLTSIAGSAILIAAIGGAFAHYLYGGITVHDKGIETSKQFKRHAALLVTLYLLVRGARYWLERYTSIQEQSGKWAGAMYTDVNAIIPTRSILAVAAVLVALLFIYALVRNQWRLPVIGTALLVIVSLVVGGIYPWIIQRFQVTPNEQAYESEYIQRNIDMTRAAYGLDKIEASDYDATTNAPSGALKGESETISNIRLLDPNVVSDAFSQLQQFRPYYQFNDNLSVDRYEVDGEIQDTVIAARELNPAQNASSSWFNQHVVYTHGYGVIAAYGNQVESDGKPRFIQSGITATGEISEDYEPRIYFGQSSPSYSIVGGAEGDEALELDRPATAGDESSDAKYTFAGNGGPNIGNAFNRLAYAIKFQSTDILLSDGVRPESQILYDRNPSERVEKVAPYLTVDGNPYPAIIDGQVQWIVDAYTTSDQYPYAESAQLSDATSDSETAAGVTRALPQDEVNYIRNSVKATVNAYDGSVTLYAWDEEDPILQAWQKVFPGNLKSYSEMSAELMDHVRYPQDLFKVQREMLNAYHVTNSGSLYAGDDVWSTPKDPTVNNDQPLPPYYLSLQIPGQKQASFSLTTSFIPQQSDSNTRNVMYGFLSANGDAGTGKDGERSEDYGKLTLLEMPRSSVVPGPGQAQNNFNSDADVSTELNLLRRGASDVINGNLLTLPVGGGILYVQPVYVQSSGDSAYPTLRRVLVSFGDKVGFAPTLEEALNEVFGGNSGAAVAEDAGVNESAAARAESADAEEGSSDDSSASAVDSRSLKEALTDANQAMKDSDAAMKAGDWSAYGEAQDRLQEALDRAVGTGAEEENSDN